MRLLLEHGEGVKATNMPSGMTGYFYRSEDMTGEPYTVQGANGACFNLPFAAHSAVIQ